MDISFGFCLDQYLNHLYNELSTYFKNLSFKEGLGEWLEWWWSFQLWVMSLPFALQIYMFTVWDKSACKRSQCATPPLWKKKDSTHRLIQFPKTYPRKFGIFWRNGSPVTAEISDVLIMCELALWATYMHYRTPWDQPIGQKYCDSQSHTSDRCRNRTESSLPPPSTVLACFNFEKLLAFPF